jgi:hypothetical protein
LIVEFLKVLPGLVLFPFSIYFFWKKIGYSVSVSYSVGGFSAARVSEINITNHKDKPITIYSVFLITKDKITIPVEQFNPPKVIKNLETIQVETKAFSYYKGAERYEVSRDEIYEADFFVESSKNIKCKKMKRASAFGAAMTKGNDHLTTSSLRFNGVVYNDSVLYAISYIIAGVQKTAFVKRDGFITGDWEFQLNKINSNEVNEVGITAFIKHCGYDKIFQGWQVDELDQERTMSAQ